MQWQRRAMALAGLVQATHLVSLVARTGMIPQDGLEASLNSIFVTDPSSISGVYEGTHGIVIGLRRLREMLVAFSVTEHGEELRYVLDTIKLDRQAQRIPRAYRDLGAEIARIGEQRAAYGSHEDRAQLDVIEQLAGAYERHLSVIEPRIRVTGSRNQLQVPENIHRIRALLLAAVRSAVLWRQVGGHRWHFLLARGKLCNAVDTLI